MCNRLVRALIGLSVGVALVSGTALAMVNKDQGKKPAIKTIATKKNNSASKDTAARRARIKKMGSATPKETHKKSKLAKAVKPPQAPTAQIASNSDGGSVAERRARIHTMRVPE